MDALTNIENYLQLTPTLHTSGQPDSRQLPLLKDHMISIVINLGLADANYAVENEDKILTNQGIQYKHIPVAFDNPTISDFDAFVQAMESADHQNTLVHCAANKRASCFTALWAQLKLGWSSKQADECIRTQWQPNPIWAQFVTQVRQHLNLPNEQTR